MTKKKTELEKCLAGEYFNGVDPELWNMTVRTKRLLKQLNATDYTDLESKYAIYRLMFGSVGEQVHIDIDFHCEYGRNIHIGNRVIINMNCTFVDNNEIRIGNDVLIASDVKIYTATHHTDPAQRVMPNWKPGLSICRTYAKPITTASTSATTPDAIGKPRGTMRPRTSITSSMSSNTPSTIEQYASWQIPACGFAMALSTRSMRPK